MNICPFKKYSNLFGKPGEGVHKYNIANGAVVDYILTIIIAGITSYFSKLPLVLSTIMWLIIGIIMHIIFGVKTATVKYLGIKC